MIASRISVVLLLVCGSSMACGSGRRSEPLVGPPRLDSAAERRGEQVFFRFCHQCHPSGDAGLGPAINNKPLPAAAIRLQIRDGLGAMPSFEENELSDADIDAIIAYLKAEKKSDPEQRGR